MESITLNIKSLQSKSAIFTIKNVSLLIKANVQKMLIIHWWKKMLLM